VRMNSQIRIMNQQLKKMNFKAFILRSLSRFFFGSPLLGILLAFFTQSCSPKTDDSAAGKKVFRYNQVTPVSSLDPAFARNQANMWAIQTLYDCLVDVDDSLKIQPCLAKNWTISADGRSYRFNIRQDVFFHDNACFPNGIGRKMTASDVAYSFGRIIDTTVNSPGSWIFKGRVDSIQPFFAPNDSTFELRLAKPFGPMLGVLTMQYCSVVPREGVDFYKKDFRKNPVGTGAFKFKKWLENQGIFMLKNEKFWDKDENGVQLPYLDGVRVAFMQDRKTAYLEMMRGKLDYMVGIESSVANELLTVDGALQPKHLGKLQLIKTPYLNTEYLGINMDFSGVNAKSALSVKKVRQALNYGFDRDLMLRTLRNSMGKSATSGFAPMGLPSFDSHTEGYRFDPEKARKLLKEAGFENGKNLPSVRLITNKDYLDLATFMSRQWEDLGVKTVIDVMETATMREMMTKGTAPFFRASWIADYPDAESYYTVFYSKNPAPPNYTRFKNGEFDALYEAALSENDAVKRYAIYHQMDKILIEEAPVIFLFYDESSRFARANITGLSRNAMNLLPLKRVKK
jgi:oligopeptide transport system substrate-binding protein